MRGGELKGWGSEGWRKSEVGEWRWMVGGSREAVEVLQKDQGQYRDEGMSSSGEKAGRRGTRGSDDGQAARHAEGAHSAAEVTVAVLLLGPAVCECCSLLRSVLVLWRSLLLVLTALVVPLKHWRV